MKMTEIEIYKIYSPVNNGPYTLTNTEECAIKIQNEQIAQLKDRELGIDPDETQFADPSASF